MSYLFKRVLCFVVLFIGFLSQVYAENRAAQYTSLVRKSHLSPDGRHNAIIVKNRYPLGSEFSLHLVTMKADGYFRLNAYSLTPRYDIFVQTPDGNIAFVTFDTVDQYKAHVYNPKKIEIGSALEYSDNKITQVQFSKDMRTYCVYQDFSAHTLASKKQKQIAAANRAIYKRDGGWIILTKEGYGRTKSGGIIFSDAEKENFTEWSPIEKPKKLPQLFTQPMPNITLETQIHWSPDSNHIYVIDNTGIWRLSLGSVFFPLWTQIVKNTNISQFEVSPSGTMLLYKTKPDPKAKTDTDYLVILTGSPIGLNKLADSYALTFDIWLVDLSPLTDKIPSPTQEELISAGGPIWLLDATPHISPRKLTRGLDATFNPIGETIEFSTLTGQYGIRIETMETEERLGTGHIYD